ANSSVLTTDSFFGHGLQVIRSYTASDASYGFFAPGVSSAVRPTFTMIDADGNRWTDTLEGNMGREAQLRIGSGIGLTGAVPNLLPNFAHSWAATMLGRHPTAQTVIVRLEIYEVPTMDEFNRGERARWVQVFPEPNEPDIAVFHRT